MVQSVLKEFYTNKKVLITGGASFIGSHLADLLVAANAKITIVDDLSSGKLENISQIQSQVKFIKGDLRNPEVANAVTQDQEIVFHLAASHGGRGYIESHPVECVNNMSLDHQVFASSAKANVKKIIFASSACAYPVTLQENESNRNLLRESDANFEEAGKCFPDGEYGWAKYMGELQLRAFNKQFGITGIACRIFTAYGERENETHAVIALIAKAAAKLDPYPIWGNGLQTRNFTYVLDTVTGLALSGAKLNGFETINIGTSSHNTIMELISEIFKTYNWEPKELKRELDKPVGVKSRASDNTKSKKLLNWAAEYKLSDGVRRTAEWYLKILTPEKKANLERLLMERD